jgi:hypothetical protein
MTQNDGMRYLQNVALSVGFLFVIVENASDVDVDNVILSYKSIDSKVGCGTRRSDPSRIEKDLMSATEREMVVPLLEGRESLLWLLGVYVKDANGYPASYVSEVVRPTSIRYRTRDSGQQHTADVRLPLMDRAAKIAIPFGWYGQ